MFDSLARLADGHARRVGLIAIAFFLLAAGFGGSVASKLDPYGADDPATETVKARENLQDAGFRSPAVIAVVKDAPVGRPATRARVEALERQVGDRPDVATVNGYYETHNRAFVSRDGDSTYFAVALKPTDSKEVQEIGKSIAAELGDRPGVVVGGYAVAQEQVNKQVEKDLKMAELIAFPLLFLLSLLFFRSLVASVLPLMIGGLAIVGTFLILRIASEFGSISIFALNLTTALGLGLSIDYSLFIVSRYREEIAKDGPGPAAMRRVLATSGRTVFFSSLTVAAALASLLVFPQSFLYSMGLGGALVALFAALIALTVLPAVLTLLGERVNAGAPRFLQRRAEADARPDESGFWYRLSRFVMRRPIPVATLSALLLIVLGLPFFGIKFNTVDPTVLPQSASARQAYDDGRQRIPALPRHPDLGRRRRRRPAGGGAGRRRRSAGSTGSPKSCRHSGSTAGSRRSRSSPPNPSSPKPARTPSSGSGSCVPGGHHGPGRRRHRRLRRPAVQPLRPPADRAGDRDRGDAGDPLPDDRLGDPADQVADHELPQRQRRLRPAGADLPGGPAGRAPRLLQARAIEQTMQRVFAVALGPSTEYAVSCSRGARRRATTSPPIRSAWLSGWSGREDLHRRGAAVHASPMLAFATSQIIFIKENGAGTALAVLMTPA